MSNTGSHRNDTPASLLRSSSLVPTVDKYIYILKNMYLERLKLATGEDEGVYRKVLEALNQPQLVDDNEEKRNAVIKVMRRLNECYSQTGQHPYITSIIDCIEILSKLRDHIDGVFSKSMQTMFTGKRYCSPAGQEVTGKICIYLGGRLYESLFPSMSRTPRLTELAMRDERFKTHIAEQALIREFAKAAGVKMRSTTLLLAKTQEEFYQNLRDVAGVKQEPILRQI